jgi:hypothetical protein
LKVHDHHGVILNPSRKGFDSGGATFCSIFLDEADRKTFYLYYTGACDTGWTHASIGVATSTDGLSFAKCTEINPIIDYGKEAVTPAVFKAEGRYYMVFAFRPDSRKGRRIGIAYSDDPLGPWEVIADLIHPEIDWEGHDIDIGPTVTKVSDSKDEFIVFFSNVSNKGFRGFFARQRYVLRHIGILKVRIKSPSIIVAKRYEGNPLKHLNGSKGTWNESLFCPGYFKLRGQHYLLPSASNYSIGFPYRQYIGLVMDTSPYFENPNKVSVLIDGPEEKNRIIPGIKSEIALDTPSPMLTDNFLHLYYAVMDRQDGIWKTALTLFDIRHE